MPIYNKKRQIPYALTRTVNKEPNALEQNSITTKIINSDWGWWLFRKLTEDLACANFNRRTTPNKTE